MPAEHVDTSAPPRILVLEPDLKKRVVFNRLLSYEFDVATAADLDAALRMIATDGPFAALVDNAGTAERSELIDHLVALGDAHAARVLVAATCCLARSSVNNPHGPFSVDIGLLRSALRAALGRAPPE
jgi:hypothetical protein